MAGPDGFQCGSFSPGKVPMSPSTMGSKVEFHGHNYGSEIGINNGSVTNNFNLHLDLDDKLSPVTGAAFDSYQDQHEDECLPGTRTDILFQIDEWAFSRQEQCIFWLNGMAGTGKSTISRTVARSFHGKGSLGASFFFKRGEADRGNALKVFTTIARQLAFSIPKLLPHLRQAVLDNPGITGKGIREQFDKLLLQPLLRLEQSDLQIRTVVIVIDALDECDGDNDTRLILQLLSQFRKLSTLYLKIFLTSRPELPIRLGFSDIAIQEHQDLILHEIPEEIIKHDISLFFHHRLSKIRCESSLPDDWPGEVDFWKLINLSIPLFIFATTICRLFEDPNWDPIDSLTNVLAHQYDQSNLDRTYLPILNRLLNGQNERQKRQLVQEFQQVVGSIVVLESPLSVTSLSKLLRLSERSIQLRLKLLHSVLQIPTDRNLPIRLFHLSFRDFLLDPETGDKTPFSIDEQEAHYNLTSQCLLMCQKLQRNICDLASEAIYRAEIDQLTIDRRIPPELQYSCRYWVKHLVKCVGFGDIIDQCLSFLQKHFLHWVEVMSLLGLVSEIVRLLDTLQSEISHENYREVFDFIYDAKRFILKNRQMADEVPLQIYSAGLIFAPKGSLVRQTFEGEIPSWICQLPQTEESWSAELQILEGHLGSVDSVIFSPDGLQLASVSSDQSIWLWDPVTGALQKKLECHLGHISKVAFSPNSRLLASVSRTTLQLWDLATGALQKQLDCDSYGASKVQVFSPNSRLLISVSGETIQLWDLATGALQQTLTGHSRSVYSVAFSSNSRLLVSGSQDGIIMIWDLATGELQHTLTGHSDSVDSVAFSSDGCLLVSTSQDNTVRLWDSATGTLEHTLGSRYGQASSVAFSPDGRLLATAITSRNDVQLSNPTTGTLQHILKGHSQQVSSVVFSSDSCLLASASRDKTVRLWDPATGALLQLLKGHLGVVYQIAFSLNGRFLASASEDRTVRLWHPTKGPLQPIFEAHSSTVEAVAFSSDGRLLASGSRDKTVRLWDLATDVLQKTLEGHSFSVDTVSFSPDGCLLASGSLDETVRLWDPTTGALQKTLVHDQYGALPSNVRTVAFSPDSHLLASGSRNHTVWLWNIATGTLQQKLEGHMGSISSLAFSPNGRLLASGSYDQSVRLWDLATGALQQEIRLSEAVDHLDFTHDNLCLRTNLGHLVLQDCGDNLISVLPQKSQEIWIRGHQYPHRKWVELMGKKTLWLPRDRRPNCFAINANALALGNSAGQISLLKFDLQRLSVSFEKTPRLKEEELAGRHTPR